MIVNLRGTHGAGKTTIVRRVLQACSRVSPVHMEGRRQPIGYDCRYKGHRVFIVGHYEGSATGGCDTVKDMALAFSYVRRYHRRGYHVLIEGIFAQHSTPNFLRLLDTGALVHVVLLRVPVHKAIASVTQRRRSLKLTGPANADSIRREARHPSLQPSRIRANGLTLTKVRTRKAALRTVIKLLTTTP